MACMQTAGILVRPGYSQARYQVRRLAVGLRHVRL